MTKPLTKEGWGRLYNKININDYIYRIKNGKKNIRTTEMLNLTHPGEKILEIGSGSGETSIYLAMNGRVCTALDYSNDCLGLVEAIRAELQVKLDVCLADACEELPFKTNEFDVVFQAGLLEHFNKEERVKLLKNWSRVGRRIISIIPNASSIAYRIGKARLEKLGKWAYGMELPQHTLRDEFNSANINIVDEYTIGEREALGFLPRYHPIRLTMGWWLANNGCGDNCGQGYLLVTVGEK